MTTFTKLAACATAALMGSTSLVMAQDCADPVKVGVLHSLSGTMAISETTLKDTMLMLIDAQNEKGGVLGCEIEAVVVDPASDWPLFAEKARELLTVHEVDVIFGNWTSVSRKSVLPVIEELLDQLASHTRANLIITNRFQRRRMLGKNDRFTQLRSHHRNWWRRRNLHRTLFSASDNEHTNGCPSK